ncbi:MAG: ABC transporter permease, partial [Gemmatimonadota bacterium]|nr:ABC transporter permease [Gemmatimonadota bacterium]
MLLWIGARRQSASESMVLSLHEIRIAARRLLRDPVRSAISVVAFTLGIGLTASMFSIAYTILFRGTPFDQGDQLFAVERRNPETGARLRRMPYLDYLDVAELQTVLSEIGAWTSAGLDLADDESHPVRVAGARISPSFLDLLRISPQLGRGFTPEESGRDARVALLSDRFWRTRYGADPDAVGRAIRLNGESFTVVGIMAPGFHFPTEEDIWLPFNADPRALNRDEAYVQVMGRLPEASDPAVANAELDVILASLEREYGDGGPPATAALVPYVRSNLSDDDVAMLWAMMIGSLLVLAIACVNVTNLLTAVAADRTGDVALRTALGATRGRIVAQLLLDA